MGIFLITMSFLLVAVLSFLRLYKIGEPVNTNFMLVSIALFIFLGLSFSIFKFVVSRVNEVNEVEDDE